MSGPLAGIRVVELPPTGGPMAGRVLAFLGAEVIHVEAPTRVNSWRLNKEARNLVNFPGQVPGERFFDRALFNSQNVNKRSLILDLGPGRDRGAAPPARGQRRADLQLPAGHARAPGLGYDAWCVEAGHHRRRDAGLRCQRADGELRRAQVDDGDGVGMLSLVGCRDGAHNHGSVLFDPIGGFNAAAAILMALHHRQATGEGQYVEIPQVEAAMQFIGEELLWSFAHGTDRARDGNHVADAAPHDAYAAQGADEWVAIAVTSDAEFAALCATIGEGSLAADPRFAAFAARHANQDALRPAIERWTAVRDKHDAARILQAAGVPAAPVCNARDVAESAYPLRAASSPCSASRCRHASASRPADCSRHAGRRAGGAVLRRRQPRGARGDRPVARRDPRARGERRPRDRAVEGAMRLELAACICRGRVLASPLARPRLNGRPSAGRASSTPT
jgi:crotonobetainyl-CoA:carnitine CoA-transferase CaiB-like acyl-CoA transferase